MKPTFEVLKQRIKILEEELRLKFVEIDNGKTASNGTKKKGHASDNRF